jgi:hypothetical protein
VTGFCADEFRLDVNCYVTALENMSVVKFAIGSSFFFAQIFAIFLDFYFFMGSD